MKINQPPIRRKFDNEKGVNTEWVEWVNQIHRIVQELARSGTTSERPTKLYVGQMYFDTTLNRPIWVNAAGTGWIKADGTAV